MQRTHALGLTLLGIGGLSAAGFTLVARAVARRETSYADGRARRRVPKRRRRKTTKAVTIAGRIGKKWVHAPVAVGIAAYAWRRGAGAAALAAPLASATAYTLCKTFDRHMPHRTPPPGRHSPTEPSFPSGHALSTMAVGVTGAYVLVRQGLVRPEIAAPVALAVPVASGIGRLYLDRHWSSDVVAGWLAGLSVAAACAGVYEALSD
jgi:membrane-associated phospholipid phosphatase